MPAAAHAHCVVCRRDATGGTRLRHLQDASVAQSTGMIRLCDACLSTRETHAWPVGDPDARRVLSALATHARAPERRYAYLLEDGRALHLVRLRDSWVRAKADGPRSAISS